MLSGNAEWGDVGVLTTTVNECPVSSQLTYPSEENMRLSLTQMEEEDPIWVWLNEYH